MLADLDRPIPITVHPDTRSEPSPRLDKTFGAITQVVGFGSPLQQSANTPQNIDPGEEAVEVGKLQVS